MKTTFSTGLPAPVAPLVTPFGYATFVRMHGEGEVDIYVGTGRVYTAPSSTRWDPAHPPR